MQDWPCDAKFSEKCPCSHINNTALIEQLSLFLNLVYPNTIRVDNPSMGDGDIRPINKFLRKIQAF